jgi:hypothetical protein
MVLDSTTILDHAYPQNTAVIRQLYTENQYNPKSETDFWQWMETVVVPELYRDTYDNGDHMPWEDRAYVNRHLRLVGGARLRQVALRSDSCSSRRYAYLEADTEIYKDGDVNLGKQGGYVTETLGRFDSLSKSCYDDAVNDYPFYDHLKEDELVRDTSSEREKAERDNWIEDMSGLDTIGQIIDRPLGDAGWVEYLPAPHTVEDTMWDTTKPVQHRTSSHNVALQKVRDLRSKRWIDKNTRAVALDVSLYNTNTRLLTQLRVTWIFDLTGVVDTGFFASSARMVLYSRTFWLDFVRVALSHRLLGFSDCT